MASNNRSNRFAAIPEVGSDLQSIATAVRALKQTVDVMSRQSGDTNIWVATVADVEKAVTTAVTTATQNTDWQKLLLDPTLDLILDKAAAEAERLSNKASQEARIALSSLSNAIDAWRKGFEDKNTVTQAKITQLDAAVQDANAKITTESIARATASQALAGRIETVSAQSSNGLAAVTNDILALSGPDGSIATQINAVTTVSTNAYTYIQSTQPRSLVTNDYWVDLNTNPPVVKQWTGSLWATRTATIASTAPTSPVNGDRWYDTANSVLKLYNSGSQTWSVLTNVFYQSRTPRVILTGDLWLDTSQANSLKRWDGTAWVAVTKVDNLGILLSTITSEATSMTDKDRTTATKIDKLVSLSSDGTSATVNGTSLTTTTATTALANRVTNVEAISNSGTANGYYRLTALSNPTDGAAAEFAVEVKASANGAFTTAGMRIQAFSNGTSRVKVLADQFIIANSTSTYVPFAITSGKLAIDAALTANNTIPNTQITGLGALATKSTVSATTDVTNLGSMALINQITSSNVATYIGLAAIGAAYIGELSAAKITSGTLKSVDIEVTNSSGNYVLQARASSGGYVFLWKPSISCLSGGNIANPSLPAISVSANGVEAIYGLGQAGTASNHGVRGASNFSTGTTSGLVGVANGYDFWAEGNGVNYGPFTGAHDALVPVGYELEPGDIVVDVECLVRRTISNALCRVEKSSRPNQKGAVGVYALKVGLLGETLPPAAFDQNPRPPMEQKPDNFADTIDPNPVTITEDRYIENDMTPIYEAMKGNWDYIAMNALGEGLVAVCGENGDLEVGDLITTSSMPGKGMKQDDDIIRNYTVAKARENVTFASPDEVKLVACIYLCG